MFGALSFVTVRQQQDDPARPLPFRFSRNDELVDDGLRAIREISELRFPQTKHGRIIERISVIETEDGGFREQAVIDANARLLFAQMHQRHIRRTGFCVVKDSVPRAKSSARAVLTVQSNRRSFQKKRTESEQFGVMPFVGPAIFKNFPPMLEDDPFNFRLNVEIVRHARERIDNRLQLLLIDRGRDRRAGVLRLEYSG